MGIPKIKSATKFRQNLYETLKEVTEGDTYIVTHKEGAGVVLISQDDFNKIIDERDLLRSISLGVADLEEGKKIDHKSAIHFLEKLKRSWK